MKWVQLDYFQQGVEPLVLAPCEEVQWALLRLDFALHREQQHQGKT
jgi:hypothetical protein